MYGSVFLELLLREGRDTDKVYWLADGGGGQLRTLAADTGEVLFVCSGVHPIATLRILANAQPDRNQDEKSLWQYGCCYGTYLIW